jgi:hypothetical protein
MGFLKGLGKVAGHVVGGTVGGALEIVGTLVESEALKNAGKGVHEIAAQSGEAIGSLADGVATTAHGLWIDDQEKIKEGLGHASNAATNTAGLAGKAIKGTAVGAAKVANVTVKAVREALDEIPENEESEPKAPETISVDEISEPRNEVTKLQGV